MVALSLNLTYSENSNVDNSHVNRFSFINFVKQNIQWHLNKDEQDKKRPQNIFQLTICFAQSNLIWNKKGKKVSKKEQF